jgi:hypothetical protein
LPLLEPVGIKATRGCLIADPFQDVHTRTQRSPRERCEVLDGMCRPYGRNGSSAGV